MSSLTTYCSSKLINKTNILFSLTIYLKKYFPFLSLSFLSSLPFLPLNFFFPLLLLSFLLLSSESFLSFLFSFFPLFSYPLFNAVFLFLFFH